MPRPTAAERFARFINPNGPIPLIRGVIGRCHEWTGSTDQDGYARFWIDGRNRRAYHYAYEQSHGPIPAGHDIDHHCRNRRCVRDSHLRALTHRDNVLASGNVAAYRAAQTHCHRGHPFDEVNTRRRKNGTRACRACARARKTKQGATIHQITPATTSRKRAA
ncbi:HNH endonuclease signature motif containing protein [Streptomyces sp. NPDC001270]|uniref:HNH endonuclease signature motif containing protein n=1 Tax=Streptomyces sp. NPDC001270 TaxID=3364554 RepID=UPI0036A00CF8